MINPAMIDALKASVLEWVDQQRIAMRELAELQAVIERRHATIALIHDIIKGLERGADDAKLDSH